VNVCGAVGLLTVTVTTALVVLFPTASLAIASSLCVPLLTLVVSHEYAYGADASKPPALMPSTWNCTLATPTLSAAFAETLTVPETLAPAAGALIDTVGGVVSADVLLTVTVTAALVVLFPAPSFAMALNTCDPLLAFVVSHGYVKGDARTAAPTLAPSSWNCTLATLTLSVAFADTATVPETLAPFVGAVIATTGGVVSLVVLFTVTVTLVLVALFPAPSVAMARREWLPLVALVESHV
jgi:hypothetical protein